MRSVPAIFSPDNNLVNHWEDRATNVNQVGRGGTIKYIFSCIHRSSPWSSRIRGQASCRCCIKSHYIDLLVAPHLWALLVISKLAVHLQAVSHHSSSLGWTKSSFFSFNSYLILSVSLLPIIIRSSFVCTSRISSAVDSRIHSALNH